MRIRRLTVPRTTLVTVLAGMICCATFTVLIAGNGVPALRHDWAWNARSHEILRGLANAMGGWNTDGYGSPRANPSDFLILIPLTVLFASIGAHAALVVFLIGIAALCATGAARLAAAFGAPIPATAGAMAFAVFNPWVYSKVVSGHLAMILSYGALLLLLSEALRRKTSPFVFCAGILLLAQLQFLLLAIPLVVTYAIARRTVLPVVTLLFVSGPTALGLVLNTHSLLQMPYTLAWERIQSLHPLRAVFLTGRYSSPNELWWVVPVAAVVVLSIVALGLERRDRRVWVAASAAAAIAAYTMGTRGPLGAVFSLFVLRDPVSGVFRELDDLLGPLAIVYLYLVLTRAAKSRAVGIVLAGSGVWLAALWLAIEPSRFWVTSASLPTPRIDAAPHTRFALYPAFQPLTFDGRGAGSDPDSFSRRGDVDPINGYAPQYPGEHALQTYAATLDASELASLGVSQIVARPWLRETGPGATAKLPPSRRIAADAELLLQPVPGITSVPSIGAGQVFFGDAADAAGERFAPPEWAGLPHGDAVEPSRENADPHAGWVDARLTFRSVPHAAQAFGGAATSNPYARLPVRPGSSVLVFADGVLRSSGGRVLSRSAAYRWIALSNSETGVRCSGFCIVALQADGRAPRAVPAPERRRDQVDLVSFAPWLSAARVPPRDRVSLLRYNVRFDPGWRAVLDGSAQTHLRVDAIANGWLLGPSQTAQTVYLVHVPSAAQTAACIAAVGWSTFILVKLAKGLRLWLIST